MYAEMMKQNSQRATYKIRKNIKENLQIIPMQVKNFTD